MSPSMFLLLIQSWIIIKWLKTNLSQYCQRTHHDSHLFLCWQYEKRKSVIPSFVLLCAESICFIQPYMPLQFLYPTSPVYHLHFSSYLTSFSLPLSPYAQERKGIVLWTNLLDCTHLAGYNSRLSLCPILCGEGTFFLF